MLSASLANRASTLVGDASFWISLVATNRAVSLLNALGVPTTITDVALAELERGRPKGRAAAEHVNALVQRGLVQVVRCGVDQEALFLSLVIGSAVETLDDGEAATLVCAAGLGGCAVIDERKATALAASRFPQLPVISTVDLLLDPRVGAAMGGSVVADAVFDALVGARMRVPPARLHEVAALIGPERLPSCLSLPNRLRTVASGRVQDGAA